MPRKTRYAGIWSAPQFEAVLAKHPRFAPHTRTALAAVLVDGLPIETAAATAGVTKQRLSGLVRELVAEQLPAGWETGVISLPSRLFARMRALEAEERAKLESKKP